METKHKEKQIEYVEIGNVSLKDSFLFDDYLCTFLVSDRNLISYNGQKEIAVVNLKSQEVYILPFHTKVVVVDVEPLTYTIR